MDVQTFLRDLNRLGAPRRAALRGTIAKKRQALLARIEHGRPLRLVADFFGSQPRPDAIETRRGRIEIVWEGTPDLVVLGSNDDMSVARSRWESHPLALHALWLFDHHHMLERSISFAEWIDVLVPMHHFNMDLVRFFTPLITAPVFGCSHKWGDELDDYVIRHAPRSRRNELYGAFLAYPGSGRDEFIQAVAAIMGPRSALALRPQTAAIADDEASYIEWASYKTSLCHPIRNDIPYRLYDALVAGQIPLLPRGLPGLDLLIGLPDQIAAGLEFYDHEDPHSIPEAHARALDHFGRLGREGVDFRIALGRRRTMKVCLREILERTLNLVL
ncbi:MAG: hypothetical protein IT565_05115 [Rhodospirillales bacterium]|nr:hypothetical protein [Rhodospirillales bacterium]